MKRKSSGFTIVELLIVIVIIGILAALVIVSYNGMQQRAKNTSRIASAKELQKLIAAYVAQEGKYPLVGHACIGAGYSDWDGDGTLDCYIHGAAYHPNTALNTELLKVTSIIPKVEISDVPGNGYTFGGFVYFAGQTIDGQTGRVMLNYFLEGIGRNCGVPGIINNSGGALITIGTTTPYYQASYYGATMCRVAVATP